jgi:hypothetical protein
MALSRISSALIPIISGSACMTQAKHIRDEPKKGSPECFKDSWVLSQPVLSLIVELINRN